MTEQAALKRSQLLEDINARAPEYGKVRFIETVPVLKGLSLRRYVLKNGLKVLLLIDRSAPVVAYQSWFRVGSRHERPKKTGLAHLFEHLMFNEVEGLEAGEFDRKMEAMGADNNASTWLDFTQYQESFPKRYLDQVVALESQRMDRLVLREPQVTSEKEVVMNERRYRVEDDVEGAAEELLYKSSFSVHPYHAPTIGWMEDIAGLTTEDCSAFYRAYYAPNNATLVVVGDLDEKKALQSISKHYGSMAPSELPAEDFHYDPPLTQEKRVELRQPTPTEKLMLGYRGPALGDADHVICSLVIELLTGGRSSRLIRRLVRQEEKASDVSGFVGPHRDPGLIELTLSARPGFSAEQLAAVVDEEIQLLLEHLVRPEELERAKSRMEFAHYSGMESAEGKAAQIGFYETVLGDPGLGTERLRRLEHIDASEVRRVARRFFENVGRTVISIRPSQENAA